MEFYYEEDFCMGDILVETFTLNGVYNLSLPQGVYIANEKKFVVK